MSVAQGRLAAEIAQNHLMPWLEKFIVPKPNIVYKRRFLPVSIILFVSAAIYLLFFFFSKGVIPWWIGGAFALAGLWILICYLNIRIYYDEEGFTAQNLIRIRRTYSYQEIQAGWTNTKKARLELEQKTIKLGAQDIGWEFFWETARQKAAFPFEEQPPKKIDPFNGNVKEPEKLVACFWVVNSILAFALLSISLIVSMGGRLPENIESRSLWFSDHEIENNDLLLYSPDDAAYYRISNYESMLSDHRALLWTVSDLGGEFTVQTAYLEDDECYEIYAIASQNTDYLTIEKWQQHHQKSLTFFLLYMGAMWALLLIHSALTVYVGRHPERFCKWILHFYFRPDAIITNHQK